MYLNINEFLNEWNEESEATLKYFQEFRILLSPLKIMKTSVHLNVWPGT